MFSINIAEELDFQILQPAYKVTKSLLSDILKNKLIEEALDTIQDVLNYAGDIFPKITVPEEKDKFNPSIFKHILSLDQENFTALIVYFN